MLWFHVVRGIKYTQTNRRTLPKLLSGVYMHPNSLSLSLSQSVTILSVRVNNTQDNYLSFPNSLSLHLPILLFFLLLFRGVRIVFRRLGTSSVQLTADIRITPQRHRSNNSISFLSLVDLSAFRLLLELSYFLSCFYFIFFRGFEWGDPPYSHQ